jgi:D-3-phosphoglycerate dehydrogenase
MINAARLRSMKKGVVLLNFSRAEIVDDQAVCDAIREGRVGAYVCDFPNNLLKDHDRVVTLPHSGASTREAEENCAVMVVDQVRDYLEHGNVRNSVNFPTMELVPAAEEGHRIGVVNANVPNMLGQISTALARADLNIIDMLNKSRGELAYTVADVEGAIPDSVAAEIEAIEGVLSVRRI